jgi:hypothetical protein
MPYIKKIKALRELLPTAPLLFGGIINHQNRFVNTFFKNIFTKICHQKIRGKHILIKIFKYTRIFL